jgi:hypothetical protein
MLAVSAESLGRVTHSSFPSSNNDGAGRHAERHAHVGDSRSALITMGI